MRQRHQKLDTYRHFRQQKIDTLRHHTRNQTINKRKETPDTRPNNNVLGKIVFFFLNFKEDISLFTKLFSGYLNPKLKLQKNIFFFKKNIPKPSDNWIQIIRFKEEYGGKYENNFTITFS